MDVAAINPKDSRYFKHIWRKYKLTVEAFLTMLVSQDSKCMVCDRELVLFTSDRKEHPCVDHCHRTGVVRGLLCASCNVTVGYLEKDEYRTYSALAYLGNPQDAYPKLQTEADAKRAKAQEKRRHLRDGGKRPKDAQLRELWDAMEKCLTAGQRKITLE